MAEPKDRAPKWPPRLDESDLQRSLRDLRCAEMFLIFHLLSAFSLRFHMALILLPGMQSLSLAFGSLLENRGTQISS